MVSSFQEIFERMTDLNEIEVVAPTDGNIITVGAKRFHYAEVFDQPSSTGKDDSGLYDTSSYSRQEVYANVVLSAARPSPRDLWAHDEGTDICKDRTPCRARR